jgi:hypothetical protein
MPPTRCLDLLTLRLKYEELATGGLFLEEKGKV